MTRTAAAPAARRRTRATIPNVLTIAGSDPSGGAGLQGDLKTLAALGVWGCAVPTALTVQHTRAVQAVWPVPAACVAAQLDALFDDVAIHAVKVGMLGDAAVARAVADALGRHRPPHVVLDPVLGASTGGALLDAGGLDALRDRLLPLVTLVTPNAHEAGALLDAPPPTTADEAAEAARALVALGAGAALVTGGHLGDPAECVDVLYDGAAVHAVRTPRVPGGGAHGTGCALASALAALLAHGRPLAAACAEAQRFVAGAIAAARELRVGSGIAPVHVLGVRARTGSPLEPLGNPARTTG